MPSAYTPLLRLTLPADGELVGLWGQTVNNGITTLIENALAGTFSLAMPDANYTLITADGATDEARYMALRLTGTLTTTRNLIVPAVSKLYVIDNGTSNSVLVKTSAGTGVTLTTGQRALVWCDGTNVLHAFNVLAGNAATATALQTARTINGVPFDGTANITLPSDTAAVTPFMHTVQLSRGTF